MKSDREQNPKTFRDRKRVLMIDDEPEVIRVVLRMLRQNGFDGWAIQDPLSIEARIAEIAPDIILLDFALRHVTGPEVAMLLKTNPATKGIPIIFLSGMADQDHRDIGALSGAAAYLDKPVDADELIGTIRAVLKREPNTR